MSSPKYKYTLDVVGGHATYKSQLLVYLLRSSKDPTSIPASQRAFALVPLGLRSSNLFIWHL